MTTVRTLILIVLLQPLVLFGSGSEPTARDPLPPPNYSFTLLSTSINPPLLLAADVLVHPGPGIFIPAGNMNLLNINDDVNALSADNNEVDMDVFVITFSVDEFSIGAVPPDPQLVAWGFPYNVFDQAGKNQQSGDEFMTLKQFDRTGPLGPSNGNGRSSRAIPADNNTLTRNQCDAGGVDFSAMPIISPEDVFVGGPFDTVDAAAYTGSRPRGALGLAVGGTPEIFFSLTNGSPSLSILPGSQSSASVYVDTDTNNPGGELEYAAPATLGLQLDDDIDAMIVFDDGDLVFQQGMDQVIFSLTPGSPSLGPNSPADLFSSQGSGSFALYANASELGLLHSDNVDMLDFAECDLLLLCVQDWAIGCPRIVITPNGTSVKPIGARMVPPP